ncbi:hypothetical protein [Psychrobacillus sp.]|uniref:hypothetical protein n=1 Tax=Psychrobacillus sp. TaxID=1871623 RepID=UPI0028BE6AF6|nr:hypothetical protein [Psychrobacillus sp.]
MKKVLLVVFIMLLGIVTVACGKEEAESNQETNKPQENVEKEESETKEEKIEVDKGLLNVELTLPASMFEGQDVDATISEAKKDGVDEVIKNADGSLTYKMSKAKHKEMMEEMKASVLESIDEAKTSGDFASIKDVSYNKDFSEFTMVVEKAKFENSMDGFAALGFGLQGMYYQLFNGSNPDTYKVTVTIKDEVSGEVLDTVVYPDAFNN